MPARLDEINSLSIINPTQQVDITGLRYANPPPPQDIYQNFTMLDGVQSCQTALPYGTQSPQWMPEYNSNRTIPAYNRAVCPSSPQQFINNMLHQNANRTGITVIEDPFAHTSVYLPRQTPFMDIVAQANQPLMQYSVNMPNPPFPGAVPPMKNAVINDVSVPLTQDPGLLVQPMPPPLDPNPLQALPQVVPQATKDVKKEGYEAPEKTDLQCMECSKHVTSCNLCQKICDSSNKKWYIIVGVLLLLILLMGFYIFILKRDMARGTGLNFRKQF
jgi:hypothetical protein